MCEQLFGSNEPVLSAEEILAGGGLDEVVVAPAQDFDSADDGGADFTFGQRLIMLENARMAPIPDGLSEKVSGTLDLGEQLC